MGKRYDEIDSRRTTFIESQAVFFVATAPLAADGFVNVSPKGLDTLRILGPRTVAYLDLTGSGIETVAHLKENGRLVLMFCAFEGPPLIVRLHGRGSALEKGDPRYDEMLSLFPEHGSARAIIKLEIDRISDSCGFGVPLMKLEGERDQLPRAAAARGPEGVRASQLKNNLESLDGLPGLRGPSV